MSPERWERIKEVTFSAIEKEGDSRARYLEEVCSSDSDLRRAVEELIEEHQRPGDTLAGALQAVASDLHGSGQEPGSSMIGRTVSHYRITKKLGHGGMGVVYKAEDTKLHRPVALKFLVPHLVHDEECRKRFEREASAAAALDHPNICTVYEIDEADDQTFIAMAFVEGQTVQEKLQERPFPLDEALSIALQAVHGLQAAHEKGIVHRDIKSANLMVNEQGQVKIMDFGLAQLAEHSRLTKTPTTLGTTAYMSPEQTAGTDVDHRTDIWALGVVLYETVTGQQPFKGNNDQAVIYSITNEDPEPLTALRSGVPMELEWIVSKCLAKDAGSRYQSVRELAVDLKSLRDRLESGRSVILKTSVGRQPAAGAGAQLTAPWKLRLPWAVIAVLGVALMALAVIHMRETPPDLPLRSFSYTPSAGTGTRFWDRFPNLAISPNGEHVAFVISKQKNTRQLWIWDLARDERRVLAEGEGLAAPFWSPDSAHVAYALWPGGPGEVWRVSVRGGPPSLVCEYKGGVFFGGTWSSDGEVIVFGHNLNGPGVLREVPAEGGTAKLLIPPEVSDTSDRPSFQWPHFLPAEAGSHVLVYSEGGTLVVHDLATGRREAIGDGAFPAYSSSGHLVFQVSRANSVLRAAPFSLQSLQFTEAPFLIRRNARFPSVAGDGTLACLELVLPRLRQLVWRDRQGEKIGTIGQPQLAMGKPELSPDGQSLVVTSSPEGVWRHDIARGVKQRLTMDSADRPVWLPTGNRISFTKKRDVYVKSADGIGEEEVLLASPFGEWVLDWSADGKYGIFVQGNETLDLYYLKRREDGSGYEPFPFMTSPDIWFVSAKLSPNGRYLAYESNESGRYEVYVQPFPQGGKVTTVSTDGGSQPTWRGDGKELFYVEGDTLVAVAVTTGGEFSVGQPERLFDAEPGALEGPGHHYTLTSDGQRFVFVEGADGEPPPTATIQVTQNWFAEFKGHQTGER